MKQKLTIQDIAKFAGVSKATVSRVLNHKPTVDPEIRDRVMQIVNERGFVPSITATVLRGGRTQLLGVLAPPLTHPYVPEIMLGVAEVTDRSSYEVVLYTMSPARRHSDVLDRILAMKLSTGLLAIMPGQLGSHLDYLYKQGVPIVTIEDQVAPMNTPWIGIDNRSSAYEATHFLISLGHRRIGHILGPAEYLCTRERYEGYCTALREAGLEPDPTLLWQGDFTTESGWACAHKIFSLPPEERPTAIFAANDQMAFGVIDVAAEYDVHVPDDLAVMGFDDMPVAKFARPALTTIRQPHREIGQAACELLLSMIDPKHYTFTRDYRTFSETEEGGSKKIRVLLPTKLIVRESCGAAQSVSR
ncbi:MAG TPA: LacI family DNA-binding transcriptional regulator [Ktedonobacteraceae bacterium]|jgi:LacI family transcriptional regulator|nr:LacI family DNA-binding transcriptional regulator [Ktedonobacteraceae bacterium]HLI68221.1 LacI family DNA-binding transcriptional regulator [Ktedonobacteraceae bacterium]